MQHLQGGSRDASAIGVIPAVFFPAFCSSHSSPEGGSRHPLKLAALRSCRIVASPARIDLKIHLKVSSNTGMDLNHGRDAWRLASEFRGRCRVYGAWSGFVADGRLWRGPSSWRVATVQLLKVSRAGLECASLHPPQSRRRSQGPRTAKEQPQPTGRVHLRLEADMVLLVEPLNACISIITTWRDSCWSM